MTITSFSRRFRALRTVQPTKGAPRAPGMLLVFVLLGALLAAPAAWAVKVQSADDPPAAKSQPAEKPRTAEKAEGQADSPGKSSGTVSMEFGQGGFILSASGGKGVLVFKGVRHIFKVGGMGIGGLGVSSVKASGQVYNLKDIKDFPGTFIQARAGYAMGDGKGVMWLENTSGVVLKLKAVSRGVSLNLGADGIKIEMGAIKHSRPQ